MTWIRIILAFVMSPLLALIISSSLALVCFSFSDGIGALSFDYWVLFIPVPVFLLCRSIFGWTLLSCIVSGIVAYCIQSIWDIVFNSRNTVEANGRVVFQVMQWALPLITGVAYGAVFWLIALFRAR